MSGFPLPVLGTLPPPFIWKAVQAAPLAIPPLESASATGSAPGPWPSPDVALPPGKAGAAGCGGGGWHSSIVLRFVRSGLRVLNPEPWCMRTEDGSRVVKPLPLILRGLVPMKPFLVSPRYTLDPGISIS